MDGLEYPNDCYISQDLQVGSISSLEVTLVVLDGYSEEH